jgi:hypothetical protein
MPVFCLMLQSLLLLHQTLQLYGRESLHLPGHVIAVVLSTLIKRDTFYVQVTLMKIS